VALSVASFAEVSNWFTTGANNATKTITSQAWSAGDWIVVVTQGENEFASAVVPTNANLTFGAAKTSQGSATGEANIWIYAAQATSSQSSQTITITLTSTNGSRAFGAGVWVVTGQPVTTTNATSNRTESSISRTVVAGSVIIYGLVDFNATNPPGKTMLTGSGTSTERRDAGDGASYAQYLGDWVGTAAGTFSFGPNNYTSLSVSQAIIEVTASADRGIDEIFVRPSTAVHRSFNY
jgi:hypothetical protein